MRVSFDEMCAAITQALVSAGMKQSIAAQCAKIHTESSLDGVSSHGLNRVPRFVKNLRDGWVIPDAEPTVVHSFGCMENLDGNLGPGITNGVYAMNRAMELARVHGLGLVALRNTTHWMRGGTYSWHAANAGFLSIAWTNSEPCMPPWGSSAITLGNNPLCIGIPSKTGHIVLDMAMSLYSYGKLESTMLAGKQLPFPGGYDRNGQISSDPLAILKSQRLLPAGLWKGSGLAIALDLAGAILSNGLTTHLIGERNTGNSGCSQIFIAINPAVFCPDTRLEELIEDTKTVLRTNNSDSNNSGTQERAHYPGERTLITREENIRFGIPVDEKKWAEVLVLGK